MNSNRKDSSEESNSNPTTGVRLPASRYVLFFALALFGCVADLISKSYVFANYFDPNTFEQRKYWWVDQVFGIQTSTNPGALFGIGAGYSGVFAIISVIAICGIISWLFVWRAAIDRWLTVALGLVTGGILGNLYDRLGLGFTPGFPEEIRNHVRDWILFQIQGGPRLFDPWPNFNIADSLLVTGAIMLFLHAMFYRPPSDEEPVREDR